MRKSLPIFYNALLLTGVNLLLRFVSTSFQVYISNQIGAEGVGLLQLVMSVGGLALTAGMAGIRTATMYLSAEELGRKNSQNITWILRGCFLYSIICSGSIALIIYFTAPYIAQHWINNIHTVDAIRLFATFLPLVCLSGCMTGYFTAANRIGTLAIVEIGEQLCYMAVTMSALFLFAGNDPAIACQCVVLGSGISACMTLGSLILLRIREKAPVGPRLPVRRRLLDTAVPLALADDLKSGISTTENLMVPKRLSLYPGTASPLAAFGMVCGMVFPVLMFPAAILFALAELLIPELARCAAAGSSTRIQYLVRRSLRIALLYGCACAGLLFLLSKALCIRLYGSSEAGAYLRLYAWLAPMLYCDAITDAMADAEKGGYGAVPEYLRDSHYAGNERLGVKTGRDYFSFSDCSIETARIFINVLIDYALREGIQVQGNLIDNADDIHAYLACCIVHKKCCICGLSGEIHHEDAIGMGADRTEVDDSEKRIVCLCRKHHTLAHSLGKERFFKMYHVLGIVKKSVHLIYQKMYEEIR